MIAKLIFCVALYSNLADIAILKPISDNQKKTCGYHTCHETNPDILNVHLVPHSHDDVGWLKTVDQYYYGSNSGIQEAGVQYIIGSVVDSLRSNPDRRFIQVETAFFWQWWKKQSDYLKDVVRDLVNTGRLEMVNGAWSMNDEAASHYQSIIDQFTWGLRIINDTVGECGQPKIGWQIDPFGHSREMASIFSQLGYEAMFFARLDYRDSSQRHNSSNLETIWQGDPNLGNKSNIFTGVLYDFYTTPAHFCWDVLCSDTPINDDEESPDYNEKAIVNKFAEYAIKGGKYFKTNNLLVTMGGDFTYQAAEMFYNNMDKLIKGFKKYRPEINVIYSTPSCYVKAVNEAAKNQSFSLKTDDFFPYASGAHSYWTGYFTSRPNSKRFERQGNNVLQASKQMMTFEKLLTGKDFTQNITLLKETMGIMQHHDAITGTEKQHVVNDYVRLLTKAVNVAETNINVIIRDLLIKDNAENTSNINFKSCLQSNVTFCMETESDVFAVAVFNPLSRAVSHYVRLPVNGSDFNITKTDGVNITYDVHEPLTNMSAALNKSAVPELVFLAEDIPPLGLQLYYIRKLSKETKYTDIPMKYNFGSNMAGFKIDEATGLLSSITLNGVTVPVKQEFLYYNGFSGSNYGEENRSSGAYIFRPAKSTPVAVPVTKTAKIVKVAEGKLIDEVHQELNSWIKQVIRVYKNENYVEFDWLIGPVNISANMGVEIISRFTTDLASNQTFYTDANGRQMVKRVRNYRELYNYTDEEPVSGNYYPVTSRIVIQDKARNVELAVLNDRAQGGSSLKDGEVELMVHRRLLNDDAFGVGEALNEREFGTGVIVRGQHYLTFGPIHTNTSGSSSAAIQRDLAQRKLLTPWIYLGNTTQEDSSKTVKNSYNFEFAGLMRNLPKNVHILTLEPWTADTVLLRLEHTFEKNEDVQLSEPVSVNLTKLFTAFDITSARETTLGANQWIAENEKLAWNVDKYQTEHGHNLESPGDNVHVSGEGDNIDDLTVLLKPMEIRTFVIDVKKVK